MKHYLPNTHFPTSHLKHTLIILVLSAMLNACASYPTQEISDARQAVRAAEEIKANEHLPAVYKKVTSLLTAAEEKLDASPPQYSRAREDAIAAKENAIKARKITLALIEAKKTINQLQAQSSPLSEAKQALENATQAIKEEKLDDALKFSVLAKNLALQGR